VAGVLLTAAESFCRPDWRQQATELARLAAVRSDEAVGAVDACLCHGAAGLGHLFNRLGQQTGDPLLQDAARRWFGRALAMRQPGEGIGGFRSWGGVSAGRGDWQVEPGFLTGASGIGLALLAAVTDLEPAWDRVMLLSLPAPSCRAAAGDTP
jgi:hypothetical protein